MRILFITSGSIGDAIISTGILGHLMDSYPEARFTVAVGPAGAPLFAAMPRLERLIVLRKQPWNRHWLGLIAAVWNKRWEVVVDLRGGVIGSLLLARQRFIFRKPDKSQSKAQQLAALLRLPSPPPTRLWASEEAHRTAASLLPPAARLVVLAPKTNSAAKDWPIERFATLARRIAAPDTVFAVLASAAQKESVQPLVQALPPAQMLDLSGKTDLLTAYAIMEKAQLFIGNDSGLLHMAAAAGTSSIGIYGPSNDKTYAPRGSHVHIITARDFAPGEEEKRDNRFMQMIEVEKVEEAVKAAISN